MFGLSYKSQVNGNKLASAGCIENENMRHPHALTFKTHLHDQDHQLFSYRYPEKSNSEYHYNI